MARLIEDENLIEYIKSEEFARRVIRSKKAVRDILIEVINEQPTVDAAPVVHGEWIPEDVDYGGRTEKFKCSACGRAHFYGHYVHSLEYEFCPMCGAKMDGGDK